MTLIARRNRQPPLVKAGAAFRWKASQPTRHPDLIPGSRSGIIDRVGVQLIGETRLEDLTLATVAAWHGLRHAEGGRCKRQAERHLICYLGHCNLICLYHSSGIDLR